MSLVPDPRRHSSADHDVSLVRVSFASRRDLADGLVGFVDFRLNQDLEVGCVALRISRGDDLIFSWPERRDASGRTRPVFRPRTDEARRSIEGKLLEHLFEHVPRIRARVALLRAAAAAAGGSLDSLPKAELRTPKRSPPRCQPEPGRHASNETEGTP